jgi:hypothetical protein
MQHYPRKAVFAAIYAALLLLIALHDVTSALQTSTTLFRRTLNIINVLMASLALSLLWVLAFGNKATILAVRDFEVLHAYLFGFCFIFMIIYFGLDFTTTKHTLHIAAHLAPGMSCCILCSVYQTKNFDKP